MIRQFYKLFCTGILYLLSLKLALGQTKDKNRDIKLTANKWSFDLVAGVQNNYFTNEQPHRFSIPGFHFIVQVNRRIAPKISISGSTGYAGSGGGLVSFYDQTWLGFDPSITFKNVKQSTWLLHTLESTIGINYSLKSMNQWGVEIYANPVWSINLSEWEKYEKTGDLLPQSSGPGVIATITNRQFTDKFEPYWFSVRAGARILLPVKKQSLLVDFGFTNGLTPVNFSYSYINTAGIQGNIRTNAFKISLGYRFSKK